jgi:hypothetical protein
MIIPAGTGGSVPHDARADLVKLRVRLRYLLSAERVVPDGAGSAAREDRPVVSISTEPAVSLYL